MTVEQIKLTWFEPIDVELVPGELERVMSMVQQGCLAGELLAGDRPVRGWWEVSRLVED